MADFAKRSESEDRVRREMFRLSDRHRRKLVRLLGNPPDASRVPESFWRELEEEQEAVLLLLLVSIFALMARQVGGMNAEAVKNAALSYASQRAKAVSESYVQTSREKLPGLLDSLPEEPTTTDIIDVLGPIFGPERGESIAITETTSAATAGEEAAQEAGAGLSPDDLWVTENDAKVCPICSPLHRVKRAAWQAKFPDGPPAHPRCRCYLEYANTTAQQPMEASGGSGS